LFNVRVRPWLELNSRLFGRI
jgi:hypothetical protein